MGLVSRHMYNHFAVMASGSVLPDVNALPGAEQQPTIADWDILGRMRQSRPYVGGHVVGAFGAVNVGIIFGYKLGEEALHVAQHVWVSVLLNHKTR